MDVAKALYDVICLLSAATVTWLVCEYIIARLDDEPWKALWVGVVFLPICAFLFWIATL